jgi:hypothetical protein
MPTKNAMDVYFPSCSKIFCDIDEKKYFFRKSVFNVQHRIFTECIFRKKMQN